MGEGGYSRIISHMELGLVKGIGGMRLENLLVEKRVAIFQRWLDLVLATYPLETTNLLRKEKNEFANPVGQTISHGLSGLYDEVARHAEVDPEKVSPILDRIIRIRAIQDFSPAQALAFIFHLKKVVREELDSEIRESSISPEEWIAFETKIDEVGLLAFNVFMACREKLYEIRINEVKNRTHRLLQRANLIAEIPETGEGSDIHNT